MEFVSSKGKDENTCKLIGEIFNPESCLGCEDMNGVHFDDISDELLQQMLDNVSFIPPEQVSKISKVLNAITEEQIDKSYNSQELNENGIYPSCWHDDEGENLVLNKRHVLEDFCELNHFSNKY